MSYFKETKMKPLKTIAVSFVLVAVSLSSFAWADSHAKKPSFIAIKASNLKWKDAPSVAPGAKIAVLEGNLKAAGPFTFRLMLPANSKIDLHTHPTYERVTILSGALLFAIGDKFDTTKAEEYTPGDAFIVPPGMPMYGLAKEETIVQIHGTGPWGIDFLNSADAQKKK
jgi:quercetin dioxygenase-like cupin family protein